MSDTDCEKLFVSIDVSSQFWDSIICGEYAKETTSKIFTNKDIQNICGILKIQIIHWVQSGVIIPFQDVRGRGKVRKYDFQNLIEFMICREINRFGIGIHAMKDIVEYLRRTKFTFSLSNDKFEDCPTNIIKNECTIWNYFRTYGPVGFFSLGIWPDRTQLMRMKCELFDYYKLEVMFDSGPREASHSALFIKLHSLLKEIKERIDDER